MPQRRSTSCSWFVLSEIGRVPLPCFHVSRNALSLLQVKDEWEAYTREQRQQRRTSVSPATKRASSAGQPAQEPEQGSRRASGAAALKQQPNSQLPAPAAAAAAVAGDSSWPASPQSIIEARRERRRSSRARSVSKRSVGGPRASGASGL
jgi:hypothetical protein